MTDRWTTTWQKHRKALVAVAASLGFVGLLIFIAQDPETLRVESPVAPADPRFTEYLASLVGAPVERGDLYQVLQNGDEAFPAMLAAI